MYFGCPHLFERARVLGWRVDLDNLQLDAELLRRRGDCFDVCVMSRRPAGQNGYFPYGRQTFRKDAEPLGIKRLSQHGDARDVPAGLRQAHGHPFCDGIAPEEGRDDWDVGGGGCDGPDHRARHRDDHVRLGADQISCKLRNVVRLSEPRLQREIATFHEAALCEFRHCEPVKPFDGVGADRNNANPIGAFGRRLSGCG